MSALERAADIAGRAAALVGGDREQQHGNKHDNFAKIAAVWNTYLDIRANKGQPLDALDVGHLMVALKLARTQLGAFNLDDYIDGAGYFACAGEIAVAAQPKDAEQIALEKAVTALDSVGVDERVVGKSPLLGMPYAAPKFKVGDRVRAVKPLHSVKAALGQSGTIIWDTGGGYFSVRFDAPIRHDDGTAERTWSAEPYMLELVRELQVGDSARYISSPGHVLTIKSIDKAFGFAEGVCSCGSVTAKAALSDLERVA